MTGTEEQGYNGWTNYATWRVNLELIDDYVECCLDGDSFAGLAVLADNLSDYADDAISFSGGLEGLAVDYARAFLADVDWYEIAQHHVEHCPDLIEPIDPDDAI